LNLTVLPETDNIHPNPISVIIPYTTQIEALPKINWFTEFNPQVNVPMGTTPKPNPINPRITNYFLEQLVGGWFKVFARPIPV
jgi:hypothetical protein